jgi:gamma-glutamyltranspeptidase/glutathione hydrolase
MKLELFAKFLLAAALALCQLNTQAASQAPAAAVNGKVVTAQHLATQVGVDVLKAGGNAVDAAVAVGYALAVVCPMELNGSGANYFLHI